MKKKICVTTGSRSEYGILRPLLQEITKSKKLKLCLIVSGMHLSKKHGMTINEIKNDGFRIYDIVNMTPKNDLLIEIPQVLGKGIIKYSKIFNNLKPDINLVLGDRDEALASALAASHMNIVNAHIHGGDKTKAGIDEYNRHAITKISNIHFAATKQSMMRIIKMGENPKFVYNTGSPSIDEVLKNRITKKKDLEKKYHMSFTGDEILLLQHPVTTQYEETKNEIINTLEAIVKIKKPTIAIAPNSDLGNNQIFKYIKLFSEQFPFIKMYKNIPRDDYLGLLKNCGVLVGNSSSGIIEASYFDISVVNIGIRQNNREKGKNIFDVSTFSSKLIYSTIKNVLKKQRKIHNPNKFIYGDGKTSKKIVKILENTHLNKQLIQKQISY